MVQVKATAEGDGVLAEFLALDQHAFQKKEKKKKKSHALNSVYAIFGATVFSEPEMRFLNASYDNYVKNHNDFTHSALYPRLNHFSFLLFYLDMFAWTRIHTHSRSHFFLVR